MIHIHCPPSEHEYTIEHNGKKYFGEYKKIKNVKNQIGMNSPIMHYPYLCKEGNCNLRFMFHADIVQHQIFHHNILNPNIEIEKLNIFSHHYPVCIRRNDEFFTVNELLEFTQKDYKKYNILQSNKKKLPQTNSMPLHSNKKKLTSNIKEIENILQDFSVENENNKENSHKKFDILNELKKNISVEPKNDGIPADDNEKCEKENYDIKEDFLFIDLTNISEDSENTNSVIGDNNKINESLHIKNHTKSLTASFNELLPKSFKNTSKDSIACGKKNLCQQSLQNKLILSSQSNDKTIRKLSSKKMQTSKIQNLEFMKKEDNISQIIKFPTVFVTSSTEVYDGNILSKNVKDSNKLSCHETQTLKPKDKQKKDEKEIMKKITQILQKNIPKKIVESKQSDCNKKVTNKSQVEVPQNRKNIKKLNKKKILSPNNSKHQLHSKTRTENKDDLNATEYNPVVQSNPSLSNIDRIYHCIFDKECNFITKYRINYEKHVEEHSIVKAYYRCHTCPLVFQKEDVFIKHKTKYCIKLFGQLIPKTDIKTTYHQEFIDLVNYYDLLMCRYSETCSFVCNTKDELKYHIQKVHDGNQELYNCLKCKDIKFKDKITLVIHSRNYCWKTMELQISEGKLMHCTAENCTFSSYSIPEWHVHLASHSYTGTKTPYKCSKCHIFLSTKMTQIEHEQYFCSLLNYSYFKKTCNNQCMEK